METAGRDRERRFGGAGGASGAVWLSAGPGTAAWPLVGRASPPSWDALGNGNGVWRERDLAARARRLLPGGSGRVTHPHGCCGGHGGDAGTNPDTLELGSQPGETYTICTPRPAPSVHRVGGTQAPPSLSQARGRSGSSILQQHQCRSWEPLGGHVTKSHLPSAAWAWPAIPGLQRNQPQPQTCPGMALLYNAGILVRHGQTGSSPGSNRHITVTHCSHHWSPCTPVKVVREDG